MKPTRKNRFKKENAERRARLRGRFALLVRTVAVGLCLVALSAGFILVHDYFMQSSQFRAREIVVAGNQRLGRARVLDIAGVDSQTNILSLNLTTTRLRLLADPWIAEATVSRQIPSGLTLSIREEQPLALVAMEDGQDFLINVDGRVFKRSAATDRVTVPRIDGLGLEDLPVAGKPDTEPFQAVMALLRMAREKDSPLPFASLRRFHMDRDIGATVHTGEDNLTIKLGFGHYREKCSALKHLMARVKSDSRLARSQVIDLYDVNRIVITLAPDSEPGSDREEV